MGFFYLGDDANTYLAKMRQGWEGSWAWQNRYTTESSPVAYLFMFWIVLGHLAALLNLPLIVTFHLARVAAAFALMAAAWFMICHFIEEIRRRGSSPLFLARLGARRLRHPGIWGHPVIFGNQTDTLDWRMPELTALHRAAHCLTCVVGVAFAADARSRSRRSSGEPHLGVLARLAD